MNLPNPSCLGTVASSPATPGLGLRGVVEGFGDLVGGLGIWDELLVVKNSGSRLYNFINETL